MKRWLSMLFLCVAASAPAQTLRGSPASVDLMYTSAHEKALAFLHSSADIYRSAAGGDLKLILITNDVFLDRVNYPFVLPYTKSFVDSLAATYHGACGERLVVTSGSRPMDRQPRNASPKSVHPTGMAIDFRKPKTPACLAWLRASLLGLENRHVIEATEERHPPHFHVAVLQEVPITPRVIASIESGGAAPPGMTVATAHGEVSRALVAPEPFSAPRPTTPLTSFGMPSSVAAQTTPPSPTPSVAKTPNPAPSATATSSKVYRVRAGDNLWTIARRNNTTSKQIQALNGLTSTRLRVGQTLKLP